MKKKAAALVLSLLILLGTMGGCAEQETNIVMGASSDPGEEVTLTFLGYKADAINLTAIEQALHGFMDENPHITVTYEGIKGNDYWSAFEKRANTGNLDDIIMIDHDWVLKLTAENRLEDLSGLSTIDNFAPLAKGQFTNKDGSVYFLPTCVSNYGLYVNEDLLKEHGQQIPTNLAELTEVCDCFVSQGITPIIANNYFSLRSVIVAKGMYPVYQQEDPAAVIEKFNTGEADITEALQPGIELLGSMIEKGWFDREEVLKTNQTSDDLVLFAEGERPFMITGGWASVRVIDMAPDLSFSVYPFPILEEGSVAVLDVNTCIAINAESEYVEEARMLAEYLTRTDVMWEYCDSQSSFTPLKDDRFPSDPTIKPTVEYLANGQSVIGSDYNLTLPLDASLIKCGEDMLNGMSADQALKELSALLGS